MENLRSIIWGLVFLLVTFAFVTRGCQSPLDRWRDYREQRRERFDERIDDWRENWQERERRRFFEFRRRREPIDE